MIKRLRQAGLVLLASGGLWLPLVASAQSADVRGEGARVEDIDFRRGGGDTGRLAITFDRGGVRPQVSKSGDNRVTVNLGDSTLPRSLDQVYDVTDFGTPVRRIVPEVNPGSTRLQLLTDGPYAMMTSQEGRVVTVEVEPARQTTESAPSAPEPGAEKSYDGQRLSLNFQDIEVRAVLSTLAEFTGLNIVASDSVDGRVTLNLNNVPWDQALDLILQSKQLASRKRGNVIVVAPAEELAAMERQRLEARSQQEELAPLVTKFIKVKYARATDLAALLKSDSDLGSASGGESRNSGFGLMTDRGRVAVDQRTNTLLIQDTAEQVGVIVDTLDQLDVAVRQVQIEARIVIARDSASRELGISWGLSSGGGGNLDLGGASDGTASNGGLSVDLDASGGGGQTSFGFGYLSGDVLLDLELRALESEGKSQTISQPRIITANQRKATISQGEERPYQSVDTEGNPDTEFKEALLSLEVTPQITPDDRIIMELRVTKDSFRESEFGGEPPIDTNTIETQVLVDNGQTVVLGGILTTEELRQVAKTPLLGDLPVIGNLFRSTEESNDKVELLVFITPRLLDEGQAIR
ncbi:type IV pilus secretin PilQ [Halomonas piscis]|uniref:Type IV pilus secretin PilQ n=1 Tax=Halomonas piscis TaxID=3031727 RepID=A0ABY9YYG8_9GAMM|nr:type IV pilus secretin PilQ [Halomonas piscis]WNK19520.1 type IV pilus secretin PilQ [Halomonas piscis]